MYNKREYDKQYLKHWRIDNKEKIKQYDKQYRIDNRELRKEYCKQWHLDNFEHEKQYRIHNIKDLKKYQKQYRQTVVYKMIKAKRKGLGFIPLNEPFEGCEGHHISKNFVIYIPEELHKSIWHCLWTGKNMDAINKLAIEFI